MNAGVSSEKEKVKESQSQSRSVTPSLDTPSGVGLGASHYLPWIRLIPSFGSFSHVVQKVHGFIRIFAKEVPSTHGLQELFHGRGHSIVEMVHQHPCIKAMVRACTDGFKIPFPTLIKPFTVMSCKGVDLPLQVVGLMSIEELL